MKMDDRVVPLGETRRGSFFFFFFLWSPLASSAMTEALVMLYTVPQYLLCQLP